MAPRGVLRAIYFGLAALALVACWKQNFAFQAANQLDFVGALVEFWPALLVNHATTSIAIDIFLFALAASIWMVVEARRTGVRFVWAYIILGSLVAISVTFPLFLAAREARLEGEPQASLVDVIGLVVLSLPAIGLSIWSLLQ